jgi:hypothetical protein
MTNKGLTKRTNKKNNKRMNNNKCKSFCALLACGSVEDAGEDGVYVG